MRLKLPLLNRKKIIAALKEFLQISFPFLLLAILIVLGIIVLASMVLYLGLRYTDPNFSPFEITVIVGLLGGFALTGGFSNNNKLREIAFSLRRIGALYIISAIAFIILGFLIPIDRNHITSMDSILKVLYPTAFYVGALTFLGATGWFLFIVPKIFKNKGDDTPTTD